MGTRIEMYGAKNTAVGWDAPLTEIGEDRLGPGVYGLSLSTDDASVIVGTVEELGAFMARMTANYEAIKAHAAGPLTFSDLQPNEDGHFECPRDGTIFEPGEYEDLGAMIGSVREHIEEHNAALTEDLRAHEEGG